MSDVGEDYREMRKITYAQKTEQRERRTKDILALREAGFIIREITPYQFRVNERLDLFPTWGKWHDIKKNERGAYVGEPVAKFVKLFPFEDIN
jgi:hypothetical protein